MITRPILDETYTKGTGRDRETIQYVVYRSTKMAGEDHVLKHELVGTQTTHVTLHPTGQVNFRIILPGLKPYLKTAAKNNLAGFAPPASDALKAFIAKVRWDDWKI